jgi:hypothetical protein
MESRWAPRDGFAEPVTPVLTMAKEDGQRAGGHAQIDEEGPGAGGDQRSREGCWRFTSASSLAAISSSSASGSTKRRRRGVEVEQLGVAAPGDGGLHLRRLSSSLNCSSSMSRKKSSGTVWSLLDSRARRIWRSSSTFSTAALRKSSFWRRISELANSAPLG